MSAVFLKVLNMSITASWLILAVVLLRLFLKKAPKWVNCLMWALVGVRLVCPFSLRSVTSLIPSAQTVPADIASAENPAVNTGINAVNEAVNPVLSSAFGANNAVADPMRTALTAAAAVWLAGIAVMLVYAAASFLKMKKTVRAAVPTDGRTMMCDEIETPFILGVLKPLIYVPSALQGDTLKYVLDHEAAHLRRRDHVWKPLGFLLLAVYWFDPLCWLAYALLCRDIETACDERVIRDMDKNSVSAYSQALLDCSVKRTRFAACPLAFGEVGVKQRVKSVLNYKKPAFWIVPVAVLLCVGLCVCLMTDPISAAEKVPADGPPEPTAQTEASPELPTEKTTAEEPAVTGKPKSVTKPKQEEPATVAPTTEPSTTEPTTAKPAETTTVPRTDRTTESISQTTTAKTTEAPTTQPTEQTTSRPKEETTQEVKTTAGQPAKKALNYYDYSRGNVNAIIGQPDFGYGTDEYLLTAVYYAYHNSDLNSYYGYGFEISYGNVADYGASYGAGMYGSYQGSADCVISIQGDRYLFHCAKN